MFIKHLCIHRKTFLGKHHINCGIGMVKRLTVAQRCLCSYSKCKNQPFGYRSMLTFSALDIFSKNSGLRTKQVLVPQKLFSDFSSETTSDNEDDEVTEENMEEVAESGNG